MKKRLAIGLILFAGLIPSFLFAQVKSYVGIVRQQYYTEHVDLLKKMSKELKDEGYNTYSKAVDSYLDGGFGSGFVWVAADGTNYIITNRHVVAQAATATVEFEDDATGEITKYENLKVVLTDDDIDIAILAFADGAKPFKSGLKFYDGTLKDGQEVWSAGFPGLGNEPVWQFGKGTVTNARAKIKELLDPEISTIIQHSAQVDSGNSGGPLLIASGKDYVVAGINSWKAFYRDSTNFAIPASVIKKMTDRIGGKETVTIEDRASKFAMALSKTDGEYTSLVNFISFHKAAVDGLEDFNSVLKFAPTSVRSYISEAFSYDPAEGLRYAIAYQMYKKYGSSSSKTYSYKSEVKEATDDSVTVVFTSGEGEDAKSFETTWIKEHGLWRIDSNAKVEDTKEEKGKTKEKTKKQKSSGSIGFDGIDAPDTMDIKLGYDIALDGQSNSFGGEFIYFMDANMLGLSWGAYQLDNTLSKQFGIQFGLVLRLPLDFNLFSIAPYIEAGPSIAILGRFNPMLNLFYEAGVTLNFDFSSNIFPGIGVAYRARKYKDFMDSNFEGTLSGVLVFVTIGF